MNEACAMHARSARSGPAGGYRSPQRRYRLNWRSFYKLLKIIDGDLTVTDLKQAKRGHFGWVVPNASKLAMSLRYLAGGDPNSTTVVL